MPTPYTTLIDVPQLKALASSGQPYMVFDCSFDLMNPEAGPQMYRESHIPGAVYVNLDTALSAKGPRSSTGAQSGGRHPLPSRAAFAEWLGSVGFENGMQAVVYDRQGVNYCGRLWWMLKWLGHEAVAVLDGGLQAWQAAGEPVGSADEPPRKPSQFAIGVEGARLVQAETVLKNLGNAGQNLIDARGAPRYRGETEPVDPVAGHIPGALNRPFPQNLGEDGRFKSAATLRAEFDALLAGRDPESIVHHCGSGVSAVPNIIAMEIAGLGRSALFAGSWSEWCSDSTRPVAKG